MPAPYDRLNDTSAAAPRLRVQHSLWSLGKLPMNATAETEWTLDEKFARVKEAGFESVECWLTKENEVAVTNALDRHGLGLVLGHRPFTREHLDTTLRIAARYEAEFIFMQPADAFTPLATVVDLV